ncbi:MAG: cytochrome c-type biogenesis protein [Pseudomonadota bacterium]
MLLAVGLLAGLPAGPAHAVQPDEILEDPALEARARAISQDVRCLVCRNENIDASHADFARDMRLLVRERLVAGDSDAEVRQFLVDRYGQYILLTPPFDWQNGALWLSGPVLVLVGGVFAWRWLRRFGTQQSAGEAPLTEDEEAILAKYLEDVDRKP